jgi:hypothetical protein
MVNAKQIFSEMFYILLTKCQEQEQEQEQEQGSSSLSEEINKLNRAVQPLFSGKNNNLVTLYNKQTKIVPTILKMKPIKLDSSLLSSLVNFVSVINKMAKETETTNQSHYYIFATILMGYILLGFETMEGGVGVDPDNYPIDTSKLIWKTPLSKLTGKNLVVGNPTYASHYKDPKNKFNTIKLNEATYKLNEAQKTQQEATTVTHTMRQAVADNASAVNNLKAEMYGTKYGGEPNPTFTKIVNDIFDGKNPWSTHTEDVKRARLPNLYFKKSPPKDPVSRPVNNDVLGAADRKYAQTIFTFKSNKGGSSCYATFWDNSLPEPSKLFTVRQLLEQLV